MRRKHVITLISTIIMIALAVLVHILLSKDMGQKTVKVGFVYVGDASTAYTANFLKAQNAIEAKYGDSVEVVALYNIAEGNEADALKELVDKKCDIIFTTSYGYGETTKEYAKQYPNVEFCQATCSNANEGEVVKNYHTFMGAIHEGRYITGVVAGMKAKELIEKGVLTPEQVKIGYVGAYPYAEVISGYTAFYLGVQSVVPEATMVVKYTDTWSNYVIEKRVAEELIKEGCVIISQHSDTEGPAVACEEVASKKNVIHVGYNISMIDIAPTTSLISTRINWENYMVSAVDAVMKGKSIEKVVKGHVVGNDIGAGFKENWVEIVGLNDIIAAEGSKETIDEITKNLANGKIEIFKGNYTGVNPYDETDTIDLKNGFKECEKTSAPAFGYILNGVITIEE